mmetsp:Transcript_91241/g.126715  ORF Transcript_91241/g.126715 Transcript_91241/m.126715 type:complete len:201 (-) Transcript_91241:60-662(-)
MAKYIMHWVRVHAAGNRQRIRAATSAGDLDRPASAFQEDSGSPLKPDNRAATEQRVRAHGSGGLMGVGEGVAQENCLSQANGMSAASNGAQTKHRQSLIRSMIWYHGTIDRRAAENLLQRHSPGTFLVRYSEKKEEYCLSIVTVDRVVQHFVTVSAANGKVSLNGHKNQYDSMMDLVDHYSRYDITSDGDKCGEPLSAGG